MNNLSCLLTAVQRVSSLLHMSKKQGSLGLWSTLINSSPSLEAGPKLDETTYCSHCPCCHCQGNNLESSHRPKGNVCKGFRGTVNGQYYKHDAGHWTPMSLFQIILIFLAALIRDINLLRTHKVSAFCV